MNVTIGRYILDGEIVLQSTALFCYNILIFLIAVRDCAVELSSGPYGSCTCFPVLGSLIMLDYPVKFHCHTHNCSVAMVLTRKSDPPRSLFTSDACSRSSVFGPGDVVAMVRADADANADHGTARDTSIGTSNPNPNDSRTASAHNSLLCGRALPAAYQSDFEYFCRYRRRNVLILCVDGIACVSNTCSSHGLPVWFREIQPSSASIRCFPVHIIDIVTIIDWSIRASERFSALSP